MIEITQEKVMQNWNGEIPLVSVCCITYNHEPYIVQALNGFLMQKTILIYWLSQLIIYAMNGWMHQT